MFGRAIDFGYSFSVDETFRKWGKDEILGYYARLIRMTRPDVLLTMRPDLPGGGQHHQASALLGLEAFRAAADPARFPEQIERRAAVVAGAEDLHGRLLRVLPRRTRAAEGHEAGDRRVRRLRPAARPHLRRDRQRGARDAPVPGLRPVARASWLVHGEVSAGRHPVRSRPRRTRPELLDGLDLSLPVWRDLPGARHRRNWWRALRGLPRQSTPPLTAVRAPWYARWTPALARGHIATRRLRAELPNLGPSDPAPIRDRLPPLSDRGAVPSGARPCLRAAHRSTGRRWRRDAGSAREDRAPGRQSRAAMLCDRPAR